MAVNNFTDFTASFPSTASETGDLYIVMGLSTGSQVELTNVRLTTSGAQPVTETSSLTLLVLSIAGLASARRRRGRAVLLREGCNHKNGDLSLNTAANQCAKHAYLVNRHRN